jgi:hypothetical protein
VDSLADPVDIFEKNITERNAYARVRTLLGDPWHRPGTSWTWDVILGTVEWRPDGD